MKQALISPEEKVYSYNGQFLGERVAWVDTETTEIGFPLFWTPCAGDVVPDQWYYNPVTFTIDLIPVRSPPVEPNLKINKG